MYAVYLVQTMEALGLPNCSKSKWLILQLPTMTQSLTRLLLFIEFI